MGHVRWSSEPALRSSVLIAAFTGWNDAGDAASLAARYLLESWRGSTIATFDDEEFVDFSSTRPTVRLEDGETRRIDWPVTEVAVARTPGGDVAFLTGPEPQLRWRTYCSTVLEVCERLDVHLVVTLGALLADVSHDRPVDIIGTASDQTLIDRFQLRRSRYEGPTGIVGVLHDACATSGVSTLSLWAAVPAYAPGSPSPKAALALVRRAASLIGSPVDTASLIEAAGDYERHVSEIVADDEDLTAYVRQIEADGEDDEPAGLSDSGEARAQLLEDLERFLREQRRD
jgi:proteasome assembly chaperone (PAC2) family protein